MPRTSPEGKLSFPKLFSIFTDIYMNVLELRMATTAMDTNNNNTGTYSGLFCCACVMNTVFGAKMCFTHCFGYLAYVQSVEALYSLLFISPQCVNR